MNPELTAYIATCRQMGASDADIRTMLLGAGWDEMAVDQALPVTVQAVLQAPPSPGKVPVARQVRRPLLIGGVVLGGIIILSSAGIALGETGYAPGISKIYRATPISFLWKGTMGNAAISLAQAVSNSIQTRPIKNTTSVKGTYELSPLAATSVSSILPSVPAAGQTVYADTAAPKAESLDITLTTDFDPSKGISLSITSGVDLPGDFIGYINPKFKTITADAVLPKEGKTLFWKTNFLPSPAITDKGRWFALDLPTGQDLEKTSSDITKQLTGDSATLKAAMNAINKVTKDQGIIRRNNMALAKYQTVLTPTNTKAIADDTSLPQAVRDQFAYILDGWVNGTITLDWYLTPRNAKLIEVDAHFDVSDKQGVLKADLSTIFAYGKDAAVTVPDKDKAWSGFKEYVEALASTTPPYADNGALTDEDIAHYLELLTNSQARSTSYELQNDAAEVARAIETYKTNHDGALPSSSNDSHCWRLDDGECDLCGDTELGKLIDLPLNNRSDTEHVLYWSDGTKYRVVAPFQNYETGEYDSYYMIEDGVSSNVDVLP